MPDAISSLGKPLDLPPVRLGNTMQPMTLTVRLRAGTLNVSGGGVVAQLFLRASDPDPVGDVSFKVTRVANTAAGEPRFRLELSRDQVRELWSRAAASMSDTRQPTRTVFYTSSFQASTGERYPLTFGKLLIVAGAGSV